MTLAYRNTVKRDKNFTLDLDRKYLQKHPEENYPNKPVGFYYQIKNCLFEWREMDWGRYYYNIKFKKGVLFNTMENLKDKKDRKKVLVLKNYDDVKTFAKKYLYKRCCLNWVKVTMEYDGFEIINYYSIKSQLTENKKIYLKKYNWFYALDFSQGCIWNLDIISSVEYSGKYKEYYIN